MSLTRSVAKVRLFCDIPNKPKVFLSKRQGIFRNKNKEKPTSIMVSGFVHIVFLEQSVDVGETIEDFTCDLSVGNDALVSIVLQGARTDEKPFADLPTCEIDFSPPEERTVRLGNLPNARDEATHLGRFFVYDFVFHSHCIFRFDFSRSASRSSPR